MSHHDQFRVNSGININFQIINECKSQRKISSLIHKISNLPVVTVAKYIVLYRSIY